MVETANTDTVIVGAGVIGLAIARDLAMRGIEAVVLESEPAIGSVISARNSGVIHAGLYYAPGSYKARFCVAGRDLLYRYAAERDVWHRQCGKLVVATGPEQIEALQALKKNAEQNGVTDLTLMTSAEAGKLEPELSCIEALHVPVSGIIDVHGLLQAFLYDAESHGCIVQLHSRFSGAERTGGGFIVTVEDAAREKYFICCRRLINAAGLSAQGVAAGVAEYDKALIPAQVLGKGSYFYLEGSKPPFSRLIYPLPVPGSSGLHFHSDCNDRSVFGPDLERVDAIDYRVDPARAQLFYDAIRTYFPNVRQESLIPDYAGIRPKLKGHSDFVIQTETEHKIPGLIHLFGIESPGLTSSMALAAHIGRLCSG